MNLQQLMLLKLAEECNEVGQECSKIMQFGMDEVYAPIGISNRERLHRELQDLFAVVQILNEDFGLGFVPSPEAVEIKRAKIMHYAEYSQGIGLVKGIATKVKEFDIDNNTCSATGAAHRFQMESIPSEFTTGVEGGEPTVVWQCVYCGEELGKA